MSMPTPEERARAVVADRSPVAVRAYQLVTTSTFVTADLEARIAAAVREAERAVADRMQAAGWVRDGSPEMLARMREVSGWHCVCQFGWEPRRLLTECDFHRRMRERAVAAETQRCAALAAGQGAGHVADAIRARRAPEYA